MTQSKKMQSKKLNRFNPGLIIGISLIFLALLTLGVYWIFPKPSTLSGQKIKAAWAIEKPAHFFVGDLIPVTLTIEAARGVSYQVPELSGSVGRLELKEQSRIRTERRRDGSVKQIALRLCGWEPGKHPLGALTINYRDPAGRSGVCRVPSFNIQILSLLPKGKSKAQLMALDVKGAKKPLNYPANLTLLWWALAGIVIFISGYFLGKKLLSRLKRSPEGVAEPDVCIAEPAYIIANRRLDALAKAGYLEAGRFGEYYAELSECAREYLENQFRIRALEMTTEEFLSLAASANHLHPKDQKMLNGFLQAADLIKFAKFIPTHAEAEHDLDRIRLLVETTKDRGMEEPDNPVSVAVS